MLTRESTLTHNLSNIEWDSAGENGITVHILSHRTLLAVDQSCRNLGYILIYTKIIALIYYTTSTLQHLINYWAATFWFLPRLSEIQLSWYWMVLAAMTSRRGRVITDDHKGFLDKDFQLHAYH